MRFMARVRRAKVASRRRPRVSHRDVLDSVAAAIYVTDLEGRFLYSNRRASEILGYGRADAARFIGMPIFDLLTPGSKLDAAQSVRRGLGRPLEDNHFTLELVTKRGDTVTLDVTASPLRRNGTIVGRVGVAQVADAPERTAGQRIVEHDVLEEWRRVAQSLHDGITAVVAGNRRADESHVADATRRAIFSETDVAILRLVSSGASNAEIGRQVHLGVEAVKDRVGRLMRRFGARRRAELSAQALRAGIV
jgi:PAS domain S-box-containing protein